MNEIWKDIIIGDMDYTGYYQVSNLGRVRSLDRVLYNGRKYKGQIMKQKICRGYWQVGLRMARTNKYYYVHKLVATMFIPNPDNKPEVGHKDEKNFKTGDECNNNAENLEWVTARENNNQPMRRKRGSEAKQGEKNNWYGKKRAPETVEKMRKNMQGKNKDRIHVILDDKEFISIIECAKYCNVNFSTLSKYLKGTIRTPQYLIERGLKYKEQEKEHETNQI
nr:MAG TPA: homing endonuclease [Caudoviricetes sp.]